MYAIKSKRTGRYYSEVHNYWFNSFNEEGCLFISFEAAEEVADFYCDISSYTIEKVI